MPGTGRSQHRKRYTSRGTTLWRNLLRSFFRLLHKKVRLKYAYIIKVRSNKGRKRRGNQASLLLTWTAAGEMHRTAGR